MAHALRTEFKSTYALTGTTFDDLIDDLLEDVIDCVEAETGVCLLDPGADVTERHTIVGGETSWIFARRRPIKSITTLHADGGIPRTFDANSLIDSDEYYYSKAGNGGDPGTGRVYMLSSGYHLIEGVDTVQLVYRPGFATIPPFWRRIVYRWARNLYNEITQQREDVNSVQAADGTTSYVTGLPAWVKRQIEDRFPDIGMGLHE